MRSPLPVLMMALAVGFCNQARAGKLFPYPHPGWDLTVEAGRDSRIQCNDLGHMSIESRFIYPKDPKYTLVMFAGTLTSAQTKEVFDAAVNVFENFQFSDKLSGMMDGTSVSITLESGDRKLTADIYPNENAPPALERITDLAWKLEMVKWHWSKEIPAKIGSNGPARNRNAKALHGLFKKWGFQVPVKTAVKLLGNPDAFSTHFGVSRELCAVTPDLNGGTMRFDLDDGSVALLWTPDFKTIDFADRLGPGKDEEDVLFVMPKY